MNTDHTDTIKSTAAAIGDQVAAEAEAVAINSYRQLLQGNGHLRALANPSK